MSRTPLLAKVLGWCFVGAGAIALALVGWLVFALLEPAKPNECMVGALMGVPMFGLAGLLGVAAGICILKTLRVGRILGLVASGLAVVYGAIFGSLVFDPMAQARWLALLVGLAALAAGAVAFVFLMLTSTRRFFAEPGRQ